MPRIKRWFPVSHDINRDPEMWDLCARFGDKALRCWLEILSIADRNDGAVPGQLDSISTSVSWAIRCRSTKVRQILDSMMTAGWLHIDGGLKVTNYWKYHNTREHHRSPSEPSEPSEPIRTEPIKNLIPPSAAHLETVKKESEEMASRLKAVTDKIYNFDPERYAKLIVWVNQAKQHFPDSLVLSVLESFARRGAADPAVRDWRAYLSTAIERQEKKQNGMEAQRNHVEEKRREADWARDMFGGDRVR